MTFEKRKPPRPHTHRTPSFADFIEFLKANEGTWVVYHSYASRDSAKWRTRTARISHAADGYDFVSRREGELFTVYGKKTVKPLTLSHALW